MSSGPNKDILKTTRSPLNFQQSIFLPQSTKQDKYSHIIKCYPNQKNEQDRLRTLTQRGTNNLIIRPMGWQVVGQMIFYVTQIQEMSLETFISLHKMKKIPIEKEFMKSFVKTYDTLNKINKGGLMHGNLKPSNIFIKFPESYTRSMTQEINIDEMEWRLAEVNINPRSQNKYYSKSRLIEDNGSKSVFIDPKENDLYSLGVILLEMATLYPIEKIHGDIADNKIGEKEYFDRLRKGECREHFADSNLWKFMKALVNPKELNNVSTLGGLNTLYHNYVDSSKKQEGTNSIQQDKDKDEPQTIIPFIDYKDYILTYQILQKFISQKVVESTLKKVKQSVQKEEETCSSILKYINKEFDPEEEFFFSTTEELNQFLYRYNKGREKQEDEDLFKTKIDSLLFGWYFTFQSHTFYMPILMKLFKPKDLAQTVIKKAIDRFDSASQFFKDQTNSRDVWKAENMFNFFHSIRVPFTQDDIQSILRDWTPNSKENTFINSLKIQDYRRVFKDHMSPRKTDKKNDDGKVKEREQKVLDVFKDLNDKVKEKQNLVSFFKTISREHGWQIHIETLRSAIKKYYIFKSTYEEKEVINEILSMGRINEGDKNINYIRLLMKVGIYEPLDLFRKILVERINQSGVGQIYKKYEKDQKGWTRDSLKLFCQRQGLDDFDEKQQNMFFSILDKDDSKYVNLKELMFRLTGIKEFDMEHIIETIKLAAKEDGDRVFDAFVKVDREHIFVINNAQELVDVLQLLDDKLSFEPEHIREIYNKFATSKKGKFEYLSFLRYFCPLSHIFMKCCNLIIESMYKGDFEKFYKVGLKKDQRKWKRQSLSEINDMLVLNFKDRELDEIWKTLDANDQNALTIEQVGQKFNKHVESFEEFKGRHVDSLSDFKPKLREQQKSRKNINAQEKNRTESRQNFKSPDENNLQENQLVINLIKSKRLKSIIIQSFKQSEPKCSIWIDTQKFCSILKEQGVSCTRKFLESTFSCWINKTSTKFSLNYLNFFLLVTKFKKDSLKQTTDFIKFLLVSLCKEKKIKVSKLFEDYRIRDDRMKLSKFETVVKEILEVADDEPISDDINKIWVFIGDPQFITAKNLQKILEEDDLQRLRDFLKDEQSGIDSRERPTPTLRSREESAYDRSRKQSYDSDVKKIDLIEKDKTDKYDRNRKERERKESQSDWRNSQMERKKEQKQRDYQREKERRERQRKRQHEREREREEQRQRQSKNKRRKDSNESQQDSKRNPPPDRRTSMENNLYEKREFNKPKQKQRQKSTAQLSKRQLVSKFQNQLEDKSTEELTRLFMDKNKINKQDLTYCLNKYYDFSKKEADDLGEYLSDFGVVKIETVKKYLRPSSKEKEGDRNKDRRSRQEPKRYGKEKQRTVQFSEKTPQRFESDKFISPVTRQPKAENRLQNPLKRKLNTPLIKQQIKMLVRFFSQRYAIEQLDRYFFDDSDLIYRDEFIKKCKELNTTLSEQNLQKIFQFLKPNEKDEVNIMNFKFSFTVDDNLEMQEDYLPKELVKELEEIFNSHDKDKSGSIQTTEIEALLTTLGFNQTQKEIENVFQKIDKNFDNQISFSEFKDFIEDFILPHLIEFENDVDELFTMLKMNDVFNTGCVSLSVLLAVVERFGVKLTNQQGVFLAKYIGNQSDEIPIYDFLAALYYSSNPNFPPLVKSALYKIKLRRKISLKEIQKTFSNISSNFIMAYTSRIIRSEQLKRSTTFEPILHESYMFFNDFYYKDFRRIESSKNDKVLVDTDPKSTTAIVEIRIPEAAGVPIPQNSNIKGNILKRVMNIAFFDMSAQNAKHCIITLEAEWDSQIQDQWLFDMKNRAFYMKIANYDAKKFDKIILLFELVITMSDNGRLMEVSCGSASISVKELISVDSKLSKKLKLVTGIPTKAKQIDKVAVSKRSGWKTFLSSSNVESQISIDIINQKNIDAKSTLPMIHALPSICLIKRKSLHYIWAFRQYFAQRCVDKDVINPEFGNHHTVRAFLLSLDIEDISNQIMTFWRQKIEQNVKTPWQSRTVLYHLLTDLHMILNTKQFQLKMSNPCATVIQNKSLFMLRQKMVSEVLENVENYVKNGLTNGKPYKRVKNYNYNYGMMAAEYGRGSLQAYINQNVIKVGRA